MGKQRDGEVTDKETLKHSIIEKQTTKIVYKLQQRVKKSLLDLATSLWNQEQANRVPEHNSRDISLYHKSLN